MMDQFTYDPNPGRVIFGLGESGNLAAEVDRLGITRAMIVTSSRRRGLAEQLGAPLGDALAAIHAEARPHVPIGDAEAARAAARKRRIDGVVGVGGGSPIGLAKAIALEVEVRLICLPTTYSGSEMTDILGITRDGVKRTVSDPRLRPDTVIYDPALTTGLDAHTTATSGMNAMAHCVEALYAPNRHPVAMLAAEEGVRALAEGLPAAVARPDDIQARSRAFYGAFLAGLALGSTTIALHHKTCHVLGGTFGLGHGDANAVLLPHVVRYNQDHAAPAIAALKRALNTDDPAGRLFDLVDEMNGPTALKKVGMPADGLDRAAAMAVEHTAVNPAPVTLDGVRAMLQAAFDGARP